ncbi:MAG TPA: nucleotidyltransferase [Candidatus Onthomonas avicola]|nr:nucleotidyltransferase [Candidatus Onthomonas avicola]
MKKPVLVVMAAGMGSRFGGLKQITPVDEQGDILMDFSLYDARRAGFETVVFVIKEAIAADFRAGVGDRMARHFDVRYTFQELDRLPAGYSVPEGRVKPWGTGHAIACAAEQIDGPFAVINADDFYGRTAFREIYDFLIGGHAPSEQAMVGYLLRNTVTENGFVTRGVCQVEDGYLTDIVERTHIERRDGGIAYTEDGETFYPLDGESVVSMNLWGFQHEMLEEFTGRFPSFLEENLPKNPLRCEYYLPSVANAQIREGRGTVRVFTTPDSWHGVTYREDLPAVRAAVSEMKRRGIYPEQLWK